MQPDISSRPIDLSAYAPVSQGGSRWIYEISAFPNMLLKVRKAGHDAPPRTVLKRLLRHLFPTSEKRSYLTEIDSQLEILLKNPDVSDTLFPRFHGLVNTTMGLAAIYEKMCAPDGNLAPTLSHLLRHGRFDEEHLLALNAFVMKLRTEHIVANDISAMNIVYSQEKFFLIDGLGDRNLIPVRRYSKLLNARSQERKYISITRQEPGLAWHAGKKEFVQSHAP